MDATDLLKKTEADNKKTLLIFNPLDYDVPWKYDGEDQPPLVSKENTALIAPMAKVAGSLLTDLYKATKDKNYPREKAERLVFPND